MTNEEAIAYFKRHIDLYCVDGICREAEETAIKALEQQPCDDAISCEAVIEWLKAKDIIKLSSQEETARKELKALPPVTPQQKYGKWIVVSDGYGESAYICECSECKDTVWVYKDADRKWNYCPSCGAKMQESEVRNEV